MKRIQRLLACIIVVLTFVQTPLAYAAELATPSATPEMSGAPEATPSMVLDHLVATDSAFVSSPAAAIITPAPALEMLTGPSGVLTPSASVKLPPRIRPMTKHTFRAGEVATVIVENSDLSAIKASVKNNTGDLLDTTPSFEPYDGGIRVTFIPKTSAKPGKYTIVVEDTTTGVTTTQDFLWGVLAFNTDAATYTPGDTASIALAVLDEDGKMVCNADVTLTILSPARNITTLKTTDGTIRVTPACSVHDYTLIPDYETSFQTSDEGVYQVMLSATTKNGTYAIQDSFQVSSDMPFGVKRTSATRIYPPKPYPMTIDVTANEDFRGTVTETVPENFTITSLPGSVPYTDVKTIVPVPESHIPIQVGMPFDGNYPVTLGFGDRIKDPAIKSLYEQNGLRGHDGADFAMPVGTVVLAADSGTVSRIADNPYGTTVVIDHSWGRSYYGHLSVVQVKEGETVTKGAPIALSGNTGLTTGAHLHFGMKLVRNDMGNGYYGKIDPMPYLTSSVVYQADGSGKQISWNVDIKTGEKIRLGYTFKAPEISPQFYLMGPLTFRSSAGTAPASAPLSDSPFVLGVATDSAKPSVPVSNSITYQEPRRWQLAADAAPNLNTMYPTAYSSETGTAWTTTTVTNIDEGIAGADGLFIVAGANSTSTIFYDITDTPSDFIKMITLNYDIRYQITPLSNDTEVLYVQVFKSDKTTALTNEMTVVSTTTALTLRNKGSTAFTGVSTTATKAEWDAAYFRIRTAHTASGGKDNSVWSIDAFEMTGTYQVPPSVSLTTPTDTQTISDMTPALVFTGTDANSDEIDYAVQVDTVNTFNSTNRGFNLKYIDLSLNKFNGPTDNVYVEIRDTSLTGNLLGTSNALAGTSVTSGWNRFTFSTPITLSVSTVYYWILYRDGAYSTSNYYSSARSNTSVYSGGTAYTRNSNVWLDIGSDWLFKLFDENSTEIITQTTGSNATSLYGGTASSGESYQRHGQSFTAVVAGPFLEAISDTDSHTAWSGTGDPHPWPSGNAVTYTVQSALSNGTYYWRVRGKDPSGSNTWGAWTSPFSFVLSQTPPTVALSTPTNGQSVADTTPDLVFTGTDSESNTIDYNIQIDTVNTFNSQSGEIVNDSYPESNYVSATESMAGTGVGRGHAQSFKARSTGAITKAQWYVYKSSGTTGNVYAKLYTITGTHGTDAMPLTLLATSDAVDASTLGTSIGLATFPFSGAQQVELTSGNYYAISLEWAGDGNAAHIIYIGIDTSSSSHPGNESYLLTSTWYSESATNDHIFYVYTTSSGYPLVEKNSDALDAGFAGTGGRPWSSGTAVTYTAQTALSVGTTYYWRVRATDISGSNTYGAWSSPTWSFTVGSGGPTNDQLMRHGKWFTSSGVLQGFTF